MKKLLFIPFIIAALILGFYGGIAYKDKQADGSPADENMQNEKTGVSLMFDFGDGKIKSFSDIAIGKKSTVYDITKKVSEEKSLNLSAKDYGSGMGAFIEAIDGYANDYQGDKYWQFWVNNEYAKIGAGSYVLKSGEVIEWKYVKGQVANF